MARKSPDLDTFPTFGALLAYLRRREQLTQQQLGIATGYSEAQISRLEGDKRSCSRETIQALFVPALHLVEAEVLFQALVKGLGEAAFSALLEKGQVMTLEQAVDCALETR
jgi:transcriptional regulator with XRE-family HTH domain